MLGLSSLTQTLTISFSLFASGLTVCDRPHLTVVNPEFPNRLTEVKWHADDTMWQICKVENGEALKAEVRVVVLAPGGAAVLDSRAVTVTNH